MGGGPPPSQEVKALQLQLRRNKKELATLQVRRKVFRV